MNKIFSAIAFSAIVLVPNVFAQQATAVKQSPLLTAYFSLKDALVMGDADEAAYLAESFARIVSVASTNTKQNTLSAVLLKDARAISATDKDIKLQRNKFASLSLNMLSLVKSSDLTHNKVYHQYCPMKKSSWLSDSKVIKNPYYGNAMLTCGKVKETF